ncbi:stage II sporulation protein D [Clostridium uliginosum]|uniref:Stage II sporulation protein D n=1 Tax=Clostridium uliginosum TaxID=119641 RepID=A0A1I1I8L8_9CLOT|nr:stage II sporulation protein D [Clostridium uliginosum]
MKINKDVKLIIGMSLIIIAMLIIVPIFLLNFNLESLKPFNINNSVVKESLEIELLKDKKVKLYKKSEDKVEAIDLEGYIIGVVAGEVPANFDEEALKAQAVAARTFYVNKINNPCKEAAKKDAEICDTTHCQVYMNKDTRMESWSKKDADKNWDKIKKAVEDTKGQVLTYEGKVLEYPQFFAVSSGKTESARDVFSSDIPYLKSEESKGEEIAPKYKSSVKVSTKEFISKINKKYPNAKISESNLSSNIRVESYTEAGGVKEVKIGEEKIKGTEFRSLFNLNSANFSLSVEKNSINIECTGYGHGVGMSQWGANIMAKDGKKYDEILTHYYNGVEIRQILYK